MVSLNFTAGSPLHLGPTQAPIQRVRVFRALGVKRPGREADHSPPSSAEVEECVELFLTPPIRLRSVKQGDNFTLTFIRADPSGRTV
jgi:hypothetical protein